MAISLLQMELESKNLPPIELIRFDGDHCKWPNFIQNWDYYEIGVHHFEKIKVINKKGNCANNFQYKLNFLKKTLQLSYCQEKKFFQPKLSRKDEKR